MNSTRTDEHPRCSPLEIKYSTVLADGSNKMFVEVPGFAHTDEHFVPFAEALQQHGISSAIVDFRLRSQNILTRNAVSLTAYRSGLDALVSRIEKDTKCEIIGMIGHSQGGLLVQEKLGQLSKQQDLKKFLTVLLAPVPLTGAKQAVWNLAIHQPVFFTKIVASFFSKKGMRGLTPDQIRALFFDDNTPEDIVTEAQSKLTQAPLRVFMEDILRQWVRPTIEPIDSPTLLVHSETDALFPPDLYADLSAKYSNLSSQTIAGGHDFFIEYAKELAQYIADFVEKNQ